LLVSVQIMKKAQQRIDKILESVCTRIQDEVGGLIGATFILSDLRREFISKEDAFEQLSGKQVVAKLDITGDVEGQGCLLLEMRDAIRLGGTLIMLPENMLDEVIVAEKYDEDTEDSYGEIANIIAGSYTKVFEEMYPENCRFVRKTQELILPVKVDIGSDEPVPDQLYYQVVTGMTLNGRQLGNLVVLLPAATFNLEEDEPSVVAEPVAPAKPKPVVTGKAAAESKEEKAAVVESPVNVTPDFDVKKHRKRVDTLLELCRQKIGAEMGSLLGVEVELSDLECRLVSKEDYFMDEASGKQILARMDVVGEVQGNGYLFVGLRDAIYIGGTLIMLPPGELEKVVLDEAFGDDAEDAYGEIANIVSGVYSTIFEEQYVKKIRFVKTGIEQVLPLKVETDSDTPMPNQFYYMSSSTLTIGGKSMGKMQMLFPALLLQLDGLLQQEAEPLAQQPEEKKAAPPVSKEENTEPQTFDVLVVSDDALETGKIMAVLERRHLSAKILSFKENVTDYLPGEVKAVLLVMSDVNEKAFALAIKISSVCSLPLIAAGPRWTRSKVITAVKYGVNDILLTPATSDDIGEKIEHLSVKLAA
jgi:chemotaxis protein CheY-P-specific phosphatase CheC